MGKLREQYMDCITHWKHGVVHLRATPDEDGNMSWKQIGVLELSMSDGPSVLELGKRHARVRGIPFVYEAIPGGPVRAEGLEDG